MRKAIVLISILLFSATMFCQESDVVDRLSNELFDSLWNALKSNFVPIYSILIILGGILFKNIGLDEFLQKVFSRIGRFFKIDFIVVYWSIILSVFFTFSDSFFIGSEVNVNILSAKIMSMFMTFMITVLSYQYFLDLIFKYLSDKGLNINSRQ